MSDEELKRQLIQACNGQKFIASAPIMVVGCGFPDDAYAIMGGYMSSYIADVTIAMDHPILAAASFGLGTCWIGDFKEEKVKEVLDIPDEIRVIAMTPLGYPDDTAKKVERKDMAQLVSYNKYK